MKKKILLISVILLTAIIAVTAAACGNATPTQSVLFNSAAEVWGKSDGKETLTYDVLRGDNAIGTFTMTGECVIDSAVIVGGENVEHASGTYFTSALSVTEELDGKTVSTTMETQSLLDTGFKVQRSYRKTTTVSEGVTKVTEIIGTYSEENYNYSYKVNGEQVKSGDVSHSAFASAAYIDNDFIYQVARLLVKAGGLSVNVPYYNYDENGDLSTVTMENVSAAVTVSEATITGMRGDFADKDGRVWLGSQLSVSLTRDFPGSGTSFSCHIVSSYTENEKNTALPYALPGIIKEGDITYALTSESRA